MKIIQTNRSNINALFKKFNGITWIHVSSALASNVSTQNRIYEIGFRGRSTRPFQKSSNNISAMELINQGINHAISKPLKLIVTPINLWVDMSVLDPAFFSFNNTNGGGLCVRNLMELLKYIVDYMQVLCIFIDVSGYDELDPISKSNYDCILNYCASLSSTKS